MAHLCPVIRKPPNVFSDKSGRNFIPKEVASEIAKVANAPVFGHYDTIIGDGIVGGSLTSFAAEGERVARVALDMLSGKLPQAGHSATIPTQHVTMYDWQQLLRLGGRPDHLPAGTVFINRPPSLWRDYKREALSAVGIIALLLSLITALLIQKGRIRQAMQSLRRSEERFRVLVEQAPEAILVYDADREIFVDANRNAEQLFGCSREELLKCGPKRFYTPLQPNGLPLQQSFREHTDRALAGETVYFERRIRTDSGREKICEINLVRFPSEGKRLIRASMADITARKQAEKKLRASQEIAEKFSTLFHVAPFAMALVTTPDGVLYDVNRAWLDLTGYARKEELIGNPGAKPELIREVEARERIFEAFERDGFVRNAEVETRSNTGAPLALLVSLDRVDIGGQHFILWSMQDITGRKQAEEALRKSEAKLSMIFHSVPALIAITSMGEGRCIDINEAGLRSLGYRREEMIGRTTLELGFWESPSIRDGQIRILQEKGKLRDHEINFRNKNGDFLTGLISIEPVELEDGRYLLSIINDITERKRMEEEIERLNSVLAKRAVELECANHELEAFNYTVAHDLRKPLTVVNAYCQAIRELRGDALDAECSEFLQQAYEGTLRMNRLITTLLEFARLSHVELHRETVDLSRLAQGVAEELKLAEPARRASFRITEGISVIGDAGLLGVVLENLLGNAWKYSGSREDAVIDFGVLEVDGQPACFVRDNGPGFEKEDAERVFLPFKRLCSSDAPQGHGVGLATVQRIIQRHGGSVWAEAEPGKGATFYFTLASSLAVCCEDRQVSAANT